MSIPINVANAARTTGTVSTSTVNYTGGLSTWSGTITGLGSGTGSDFENTANHLTIGIFYEDPLNPGSFILYSGFTWDGGPNTHTNDAPPAFSFGLANLPIGNVRVTFTFTGSYTCGLSSTLA